MKRIGTLLVSALFLASLLLGCVAQAALESQPGTAPPETKTLPEAKRLPESSGQETEQEVGQETEQETDRPQAPEGNRLSERFAPDYDAVLAALQAGYASQASKTESLLHASAADGVPEAVTEAPADSAAESAYSGTNVQVEGVDEADVVKTDGAYIYHLSGNTISVYEADGAQTRLLTRLTAWDDDGWTGELYLTGDLLLVIRSRWEESDQSCVTAYDVSDPASPQALYTCWQEGWYQDSRLSDGRLYLISTCGVYNWDEADPQSFVPTVCDARAERLLLPGEIWLPPECGGTEYMVVSCFDAADGSLQDTCALMGGGGTCYCTGQSLYLAWREDSDQSEDRMVDDSAVTRYSSRAATRLVRFDLRQGLCLAAETTLDGYLDSQFSLDEYQGFLRLVLTQEENWSEVWQEGEKTSYRWPEDVERSNSLLILDETLQQTGRIDGLGQNERIYSARFDGDYGYFVTFRQTDPLFCVELSDPCHPVVRSQLQLPGFSDYLQFWSQGRLLGLGYAGDENGATGGMKLSMYDTSNPFSISERHTLPLAYGYSRALHDHKALLLAADRNLIGFPTDEGYAIFRYDEDSGFALCTLVELDWDWDARGLYIDDCLYICGGSGLTVLSLDTLEPVQRIEIERNWIVVS